MERYDQRDMGDEAPDQAPVDVHVWSHEQIAGCPHNVRIRLGQRGDVCHLCEALGFGGNR